MKYKLGEKHPKFNLFRVVALKDFGNVKKDDIGGWVESEKNLSQEGDCWVSGGAQVFGHACVYGNAVVYGSAQVFGHACVYGNAVVYGDAWVCGHACVYGNARVYGKVRVYGNAWAYGSAEVYENARVYGNAWVFESARVYGNAVVYGDARVYGDSVCTRRAYAIDLDRDSITATDNHIQIGCEFHTYEYWMENYRQIGEKNEYTDGQIEDYKAAIDFLYKINKRSPE